MAWRIIAGSRFMVPGSMSTNTGVAPMRSMASPVAKNVNDDVMTSSPGFTPAARSPMIRASVPEFTPMQCSTPMTSAMAVSNCDTSGPRMNEPVSRTPASRASNSARCAAISGFGSYRGIIGLHRHSAELVDPGVAEISSLPTDWKRHVFDPNPDAPQRGFLAA